MAIQDFSTYNIVDPNGRFAITPSRITWTRLRRNESAYIYKDFGVDFFNGYFMLEFEISYENDWNIGTLETVWAPMLANIVGNIQTVVGATGDAQGVCHQDGGALPPAGSPNPKVLEIDGGVEWLPPYGSVPAFNTIYYFRLTRDETIGAFGLLLLEVFTDAARTILAVGSGSITLHTSMKDFRYLFPVMSRSIAQNFWSSGFIQNLTYYGHPHITSRAASNIISVEQP